MIRRQFVLLIFIFISAYPVFAQLEFDPRKDFTYGDDYFKPYSPYLTVNYGYGYNINQKGGEQNLAVDLHFRFKFEYLHFNVGYFSSSDKYLESGGGIKIHRSIQRCHNFHIGAGTRYSVLKHDFGVYGGIALVRGIQPLNDSTGITRLGPGVYAQMHYHFKPIYDIGVGVNLYIAISEHFQIFGAQLSILFSADFKPPSKGKIY